MVLFVRFAGEANIFLSGDKSEEELSREEESVVNDLSLLSSLFHSEFLRPPSRNSGDI